MSKHSKKITTDPINYKNKETLAQMLGRVVHVDVDGLKCTGIIAYAPTAGRVTVYYRTSVSKRKKSWRGSDIETGEFSLVPSRFNPRCKLDSDDRRYLFTARELEDKIGRVFWCEAEGMPAILTGVSPFGCDAILIDRPIKRDKKRKLVDSGIYWFRPTSMAAIETQAVNYFFGPNAKLADCFTTPAPLHGDIAAILEFLAD